MDQKTEQQKQSSTKQFRLLSLHKQAESRGQDWLSYISEFNSEAVTCDGFESCIIGVANRFGMEPVVAYDYDKCIELLVSRDGMPWDEAVEFFECNVSGAWIGEGTPVFISTNPP